MKNALRLLELLEKTFSPEVPGTRFFLAVDDTEKGPQLKICFPVFRSDNPLESKPDGQYVFAGFGYARLDDADLERTPENIVAELVTLYPKIRGQFPKWSGGSV